MPTLLEERRQSGTTASTSNEENPAAGNAASILSLTSSTVRSQTKMYLGIALVGGFFEAAKLLFSICACLCT